MAGPLPGGHIVRPLGLMGPLPSGLTFPQQSPSHVFRVFGVSVTNRTEKRPQRKKAKESGAALHVGHFMDICACCGGGLENVTSLPFCNLATLREVVENGNGRPPSTES